MFRNVYTGFAIGSTILGITGLVQCWKTEGLTKIIALTAGVGGTSAALVTVGLGIAYDDKHRLQEEIFDKKVQGIERENNGKINGLKLEIDNLRGQIKILEKSETDYKVEIARLTQLLNTKAEEFLRLVAEKDLKISQLQGIVNQRDNRIEDFLEDCRGYTTRFLNERYKAIDALHISLEKGLNDSKVSEALKLSIKQRIQDIKGLKAELNLAVNELKGLNITDFQVVLDFIFSFDNKFLNVKTRWKDVKIKDFKNESLELKSALDDSMPKSVVVERFNEELNNFDAQVTEKYEALLLNNNSIHAQLLELLDQKHLVINDLQRENEALHKVVDNPFEMYGGSKYAENATRISRYYHDLIGKKLDCLDWQETELGYKLIFSVRRNPSVTINQLKQNESLEQIAYLAQALDGTTPEFTIHTHNATVSLDVQTRRPIKKALPTIDDIFRECGVIRSELFGSTLHKYHIDKIGKPTLRVMSATGGGKGIAIKNLVDYYLKNLEGYEIWLSDPQDGSEEDYWDCEKAATNPNTATKLFNRYAQLLRTRDAKTSTEPATPILGVFDEFDKKHPKEDRQTANQIWTTIRHHSMRLVLIGQSAEVGKNGWTWDEMTNCCLLFITDAIPTFIKHADKDLQMDTVKLKNFLDAYNKVKIRIDDANQVIDPENQYRLAALYCGGQALLLEIPPAHKGVLSDGKSWLATEPFTKNQSEMPVKHFIEIKPEVTNCVHCGSTEIKKDGKHRKNKTIQMYKCLSCKKGFSEIQAFNKNSNE